VRGCADRQHGGGKLLLKAFIPERLNVETSSFFIIAVLLAMGDARNCFLLFLACLIHESGHLLCAGLCQRRIKELSISASGAKISLAGNLGSYKKDIAIALSGSAANFFTCVMMRLFIGEFTKAQVFFFFCNLLLGLCNLICAGDLDGAVATESVLYYCLEADVAARAFGILQGIGAFLLLALGMGVMALTGGNFSVLFLWLGILIKNKKDRKSGLFR
jgi:Zn-dependent protease